MIREIACIFALLVLCGCRANDPAPSDENLPAGSERATQSGPAAGEPTAPPPTPAERAAVLGALSQPVPVLPMKIDEIQPQGEVMTYVLEPDYFTLAIAGQPVRVPVVLERTPHHVRASVQYNGATQEWAGDAWCFDLHSTDPAHPFTHTFWLKTHKEPAEEGVIVWPPSRVQFFASRNSNKYLAGLTTGLDPKPWLLDVSQTMPSEETLREYITRKVQIQTPDMLVVQPLITAGEVIYEGSAAVRYIPWRRLFPADAFSRSYGPIHIEIKDVSEDEKGNLVVCVVGMDPAKVFKAVFDGKEWRAAEDETPTPP